MTILLLPVLVFVMLITAKVLSQKHQIDSQIAKLQAEADKIKSNNEELGNLIKYLSTPEYQEKEAREKLNLQKEGEHVVVLPDSEAVSGAQKALEQKKESNFKQWFNYFFHEQ